MESRTRRVVSVLECRRRRRTRGRSRCRSRRVCRVFGLAVVLSQWQSTEEQTCARIGWCSRGATIDTHREPWQPNNYIAATSPWIRGGFSFASSSSLFPSIDRSIDRTHTCARRLLRRAIDRSVNGAVTRQPRYTRVRLLIDRCDSKCRL